MAYNAGMKHRVLFATNNPGKLHDAQRFAQKNGFTVLSPRDLGIDIDVIEDGTTFTQNADKKYVGFLEHIDNPDIWVITDDSGLQIPALNNEPGVYSRRWAGHEMTDQEIIDYCLEKMKNVKDRRASFTGVLAVGKKDVAPHHISFSIEGELLREPIAAEAEKGLPFRSLFYLPQYGKMLHQIHDLPYEERDGILTHREKGLQAAFDYISQHTT